VTCYCYEDKSDDTKDKFNVRGCIQKFPDWPPGTKTANGTALWYWVQLYRYFVSQSSDITFCVASRVFIVGYTIVRTLLF
jgi:hypothetical protein